jgi:hypothetical protein
VSDSVRAWVIEKVGAATFERLARELSASELQSVLHEVMRVRAEKRTGSELVAQYSRDPFCQPCAIDPRELRAIDAHLLESAAERGFSPIELSPVAPLGSASAVAITSQARVLSALRGTEVVSDPTNVLALECARRMRGAAAPLHLAACQRVVRAQPVPKVSGFAQHFGIVVLASGGAEEKDHAFTVRTMVLHVQTMLAALDRLEAHGYAFGRRRVEVLATDAHAGLGDRVADAIGVATARKPLAHAYYSGGLRFMLWVTGPDGAEVPLIDGGAFDWLVRLTSNRRLVYVASGGGAQLVARFRRR